MTKQLLLKRQRIPAANGIPINPNNLTYGLSAGFSLSQGTTDMMLMSQYRKLKYAQVHC